VPLVDANLITGKGTTLKAALAFVEARFGSEGIERLTVELGADEARMVKGMVLSGGKYPLAKLVAVYEAIDRVFGRGDLALCWDIGKFAGDYEVNLLHKVFLNVARLEYWLKISGASWRFYYSHGKLTAAIEPGKGYVRLGEFNPISKAFCYRFGGWIHAIIELSRKTGVAVRHTECVLDGKPLCVWEGRWDE